MDRFPLVRSRRPLIPGTRIALRADVDGVSIGGDVVVVFVDEGSLGSVGTLGRLDAIHQAASGPVLDVNGRSLVRFDTEDEGGTVAIQPLDSDPTAGGEAIAEVQAMLRRYMAVRAEAGEGGDVMIELSPQPVAASHEVASVLKVSSPEIQDVLEAGDASERLARARNVLRRETTLLRRVLEGGGS